MKYDIVVIGSGPGGYVTAIRCAQLGMKTAIVEKYKTMGGTCLNVGCIPSKALLSSSEHYYDAKKNFAAHGISVEGVSFDFEKIMARKENVIDQNCKGVEFLMGKNKIDTLQGHASFKDSKTLVIKNDEGEQVIEADKTIIATGSKPSSIPGVTIDKNRVISSTELLSLKEVPETLTIIGAGVIGLELGSVYARLGTKVEVVEYMDSAIPTMDKDLGKELARSLKKMGMKLNLSHKVQKVEMVGDKAVTTALNKKDKEVQFEADYCAVAVGRRAYTEGLGLENLGIEVNRNGTISVNDNFETKAQGVYAIGDVIGGMMLAHKASEEGVYVAETLAGLKPHLNYNAIPGVVYTHPEVSCVGPTEEQLKADEVDYLSGTFTYRALGRARATNEISGFIKVLADAKSHEILGMHMIGACVGEMISEAVVAVEKKATLEEIGAISHAHPTYSEGIKEACLAALGRCVHS